MRRPALGALFLVLAVCFGGITYASARAAEQRPGLWAIVAGAAALTLWLAALGVRSLRG
jgi:D-arabinose 1-dehydrogenase-like Zn-dependent alcohol dehydrogenase